MVPGTSWYLPLFPIRPKSEKFPAGSVGKRVENAEAIVSLATACRAELEFDVSSLKETYATKLDLRRAHGLD